jgi:voltage-gated potassium channel
VWSPRWWLRSKGTRGESIADNLAAVEQRWKQLSEWPLTAVALLFLVAYAWPILDPGLSSGWRSLASITTTVAWVVFAVDYLVRVAVAERRLHFVVRHPFDLAVVVLPLLRPLRLLRLVTLLSVLNQHAGGSLRGRVIVYVTGATGLVSFVAALAVLDAERRSPDANITSFGDALWWAMTTMTTVGYGDRFPVSSTGRAVATGLMLAGIALLGVVTATLASWLVERVAEEDERSQAATREQVADLTAELRALRAEIASTGMPEQRSSLPGAASVGS